MSARLVVVGNGGFAVRCLKLMRDKAFDVALVIPDPNAQVLHGVLEKYCAMNGLPLLHAARVNEERIVEATRGAQPDFLFSVYSMQLLGAELLSVPRQAAINFHNGPLPRYRGVNVYSWAIINGETEYGVTWHLMASEIDAGGILAQQTFAIRFDDTPTTLMQRGFDAGVASLANVLDAIRANALRPREQNTGEATYYSRKQMPNGGRFDFSWTFARLERFARGLDFRPLPNTFARPTASFREHRFHAQSVRLVSSGRALPMGRVSGIDPMTIKVQALDAVVGLAELLDESLSAVSPAELAARIGLRVGDTLE